jgi:Rrf2 family transcriptional regulator, nitric oxide-sensitive transcriptional repressor
MMKLNRKIEYALIALKYISEKFAGQLTTVKEICESTRIPFDATSRVMQLMVQQNILKAEHGAYGGYLLVKDLSKVSLLEVIECVAGPIEIVRCITGQEGCEFLSGCGLVSPLRVLNEKHTQFYRTISIADLLQMRDREGRDNKFSEGESETRGTV